MDEPVNQNSQDNNSFVNLPPFPSENFVIAPPPSKKMLPRFPVNLKKMLPIGALILLVISAEAGTIAIKQRQTLKKAENNCQGRTGFYCEGGKILNCTGSTVSIACQHNRCSEIDTLENCQNNHCDKFEASTNQQNLANGEWSLSTCFAPETNQICQITQSDWIANGQFACGEDFKRNCPIPYICSPTSTPTPLPPETPTNTPTPTPRATNTPTPTPRATNTPTPPPLTLTPTTPPENLCHCTEIKVYNMSWNEVDLSNIQPGTTYRFAVIGVSNDYSNNPVNKARFRINGKAEKSWCDSLNTVIIDGWCETVLKKPPSSNVFYIEYTPPPSSLWQYNRYIIEAEVQCLLSGWQ